MIPIQTFELVGLGSGTAILVIGLLALLLFACITFRNPLGMVSWGMSVMVVIFTGLFDVGIELFWLSLVITVILVVVGVTVRWVN